MYQHPAALEMTAAMHQEKRLREAQDERLARLVQSDSGEGDRGSLDRLVACTLALVVSLAAIALVL